MVETAQIPDGNNVTALNVSPPPDHNSAVPNQSDFLTYVARQRKVDEQIGELNKKKSNIRKDAKLAGVVLKQMDAVIALADMGPDAAEEHLRVESLYMRFMGLPTGPQGDLMTDMEPVPTDGREHAYQHGYMAGFAQDADNPHDQGSEEGQLWIEGNSKGFDDLKKTLKAQGAKLN